MFSYLIGFAIIGLHIDYIEYIYSSFQNKITIYFDMPMVYNYVVQNQDHINICLQIT